MADIDPAVAQQVLSMQDMEEDPQAIQLARRQKTINAMRGQAMATDDGHMMGKVYAPGNTLATTIARVGQGAAANYQQSGQIGGNPATPGAGSIDAGYADLGQKRVAGRGAYFNALTNAMRRRSPANTPGVGSNIGPDVGGNDTPDGLEH